MFATYPDKSFKDNVSKEKLAEGIFTQDILNQSDITHGNLIQNYEGYFTQSSHTQNNSTEEMNCDTKFCAHISCTCLLNFMTKCIKKNTFSKKIWVCHLVELCSHSGGCAMTVTIWGK